MFANLRFNHDEVMGYDELSFDLTQSVMDKLWAMFAEQRQCIERVGLLSDLTMWDGEKDIWLGITALGGCINLSMETQRISVDLFPEYDRFDPSEPVAVEHNWIRFAPIMRWLKEILA